MAICKTTETKDNGIGVDILVIVIAQDLSEFKRIHLSSRYGSS